MLTSIYSIPDVQYHEYTGPNLRVTEEGRIRSDCKQLFKQQHTAASIWPPPKQIPSDLYNSFTMNGLIPVKDNYRYSENEKANEGNTQHWSREKIDDMGNMDNTCGVYNHKECDQMIQKYGHRFINKKRGVVIGSSTPWAEAALLSAGAKHITTIEYRNITTNHPNLTTYRPEDIAHMYVSGEWKLVDFIFTYSSVEHDGLGRYGDPLNPFGDLEALSKAKCLLKPGNHVHRYHHYHHFHHHHHYGRWSAICRTPSWTRCYSKSMIIVIIDDSIIDHYHHYHLSFIIHHIIISSYHHDHYHQLHHLHHHHLP